MATPDKSRAADPGDAPADPSSVSTAATARDRGTAKARERELKRQEAVTAAVAEAHDDSLPKLGGPMLEPGLGR